MTDPLVPPDLIETFARGWARTRRVAPPAWDSDGLRIETSQPHETRRFIFPRPPAGIAALAARITEPRVLLKAAMPAEAMAALLPAGWHVEQTGTTMTCAALPDAPPQMPPALRLHAEWRDGVHYARLLDRDGEEAARGRLTLVDDWALHDAIEVAEAHRRHGLGTAIMTLLALEARRHGVTRGLLNATVAGRALYETMGWTARAPWTTAQIPA